MAGDAVDPVEAEGRSGQQRLTTREAQSSSSSTRPQAAVGLRAQLEALKDYAEDLRSVTWLAPVTAAEMNQRDRWLADEIDKIADAALALLLDSRNDEHVQEDEGDQSRMDTMGEGHSSRTAPAKGAK